MIEQTSPIEKNCPRQRPHHHQRADEPRAFSSGRHLGCAVDRARDGALKASRTSSSTPSSKARAIRTSREIAVESDPSAATLTLSPAAKSPLTCQSSRRTSAARVRFNRRSGHRALFAIPNSTASATSSMEEIRWSKHARRSRHEVFVATSGGSYRSAVRYFWAPPRRSPHSITTVSPRTFNIYTPRNLVVAAAATSSISGLSRWVERYLSELEDRPVDLASSAPIYATSSAHHQQRP